MSAELSAPSPVLAGIDIALWWGVTWLGRIFVFLGVWLSLVGVRAEEDPIQAAAQARMRKELSEGKLPKDFLESFEILSNDQLGMEVLLPKLQELLHKLYPDRDFAKHPIRILISASEEPNGFRVGYANPPIVVITRGLLRKYKTEGQIQVLLAHEETHQWVAEKLGEGKNSKGEEMMAVVRPLYVLHDAGVDPRETLDELSVMEEIQSKQGQSKFSEVMGLFDVHPLLRTQRRALQTGLTAIKHERGTLPEGRRPLEPGFYKALDRPKHESYVQAELSKKNYEGLSLPQKIDALRDLIRSTKYWNRTRLRELRDRIEKLKPWEFVQSQPQEARALLNAIVEVPSLQGVEGEFDLRLVSENLYGTFPEYSRDRIIGPLKELREDIIAFSSAKDFKVAQDLAAKVNAYLDNQRSFRPEFVSGKLSELYFDKPDLRKHLDFVPLSELSWNKAVVWAKEDPTGNVRTLLFRLGIHDIRLYEGLGSREVVRNMFELDPGFSTYSWGPKPFDFDYWIKGDRADFVGLAAAGMAREYRSRLLRAAMDDLISKAILGDAQAKEVLVEAAEVVGHWTPQDGRMGQLMSLKSPDQIRREMLVGLLSQNSKYLGLSLIEKFPELFGMLNVGLLRVDAFGPQRELVGYFGKLQAERPQEARDIVRAIYFSGLSPKTSSARSSPGNLATQFSFALDSPILNYLLEAPAGYFSMSEIGDLYSKHCKLEELQTKSGGLMKFLGFDVPMNGPALIALAENLPRELGSFRDEIILTAASPLAAGGLAASWDIAKFISLISPEVVQKNRTSDLANGLFKALRPEFAENPHLPESLADAVRAWTHMHSIDFFPEDNALRFDLLKSLLERIDGLKDPAQRIRLLEEILLSARIQDPDLRRKAMESWANAQREILGLDRGQPEMVDKVKVIVDRVKEKVNSVDRLDMFSKLADKIESQERVSELFEANILDLSRESLEKTFFKGILTEVALTEIQKSSIGRKAVLEFLTGHLNQESAHRCARYIRHEIADYLLPKEKGLNAALIQLHKNFWAASLSQRSIILDQLLFPMESEGMVPTFPNPKAKEPLTPAELAAAQMPEGWEGVFEYVLEKVFPTPAEKSGRKYERSQQAKRILRAYIHSDEEFSRGLFLASLMAAAEKVTPDQVVENPGKFLGALLTRIDPATNRLAQLIDSNPSTPEDLRSRELEDSKIRSDVPPRWTLWRIYKKQVPEEVRKGIQHIGKILGAATDWITVQTEEGGESDALAMQRPWIRERTRAGYDRLDKTAELLSADPLARIIRPLIAQAKKASEQGLNPALSMQQYEQAVKQYDQVKLTVDGFEFMFKVAKWKKVGPTYRKMELAKGMLFKDLPENSPAAMARKKAWAKAVVFWNLGIIVGGGVFDDDRHNGQGQIEGDVYTLYDWGGMSVEEPSAADRKDLGEILFEARESKGDAKKIGEILNREIQARIARDGKSPEYLVRVQRALISLGNYMKYLDAKDFEQILESILKANLVHAEVQAAVRAKAVGSMGAVLKFGLDRLRGAAAGSKPDCAGALIELGRRGRP